MTIRWRTLIFLLLGSCSLALAVRGDDLQPMTLTVDGQTRTALVHVPPGAAKGTLPVVFAFHGHGGNSRNAVEKFGVNRLWPEAISVYPQGLPTVGARTDPAGDRSGWQKREGELGDRDLHFFDALLARIEKDHPVDPKRIYATGHSNGGGFTYLLWLTRPRVFAAFAPCSGGAGLVGQLTPKPALVSGGRGDEIVPFERQERAMETLRRVNECEPTGRPWGKGATEYPSKGGTPLVTFIYDGGHLMDPAEAGLIVKFFREHPGS